MASYGKQSSEKVEATMKEMKEGKLKSGSGKKVTNPKQAIAIGLSEARKEGGKVPPAKKAAGNKTAAAKAPAKKAPAKKATGGRTAAASKGAGRKSST